MRSLASALPPGLSTRSTIALTVFSSAAWRTALMNVSEPSVSPPKKLVELLPDMIAPTACTTAILGFELRRFCLLAPHEQAHHLHHAAEAAEIVVGLSSWRSSW